MLAAFNRRTRREPITLEAKPVFEERLTASEFLTLVKEKPELIKSSHVVLPKAGRDGFGAILVRYTHPIYKTS